jgi:hypothetical protein
MTPSESNVRDITPALRRHCETYIHILAAQFASELCINHHPRKPRAQGEPGGRCTRGLRAKNLREARESPQVQAGSNRPSLRSGLRLIRDLPGEPALATVAGHDALASSPTWRVHGRARTTRLRRPRMCRSSTGPSPSTAFRSTCRDDRDTPLRPVRNEGAYTPNPKFGK